MIKNRDDETRIKVTTESYAQLSAHLWEDHECADHMIDFKPYTAEYAELALRSLIKHHQEKHGGEPNDV